MAQNATLSLIQNLVQRHKKNNPAGNINLKARMLKVRVDIGRNSDEQMASAHSSFSILSLYVMVKTVGKKTFVQNPDTLFHLPMIKTQIKIE